MAMNPHRVLTWAGAVLAAAVVLLALGISAFRVVVPHVPQYRDEVATWAGGLLGAPVDIGTMDLQWRRARPELILGDVRFVSADARHAFAAREVRVGISVNALARWRVAPARIVLVEPDLTLDLEAAEAGGGAGWRRAFAAREHRGEVVIEDGRATVLSDGGRRRVDLERVGVRLASDGANHALRVTARPGGVDGTFAAAFEARGWPEQRGWQADGTLELRGIDLVAAQHFGRAGRLEDGRADVSARVSVSDVGQRVSGELGLSGLRWFDGTAPRRVDRAVAEFGWDRRGGSWQADLRRLTVSTGTGVRESGVLTVRHVADGQIRVGVDAAPLYIEDLAVVAESLPWLPVPEVGAWLARNPRGVLRESTVVEGGPERGWRGRIAAGSMALDADPGERIPGFDGLDVEAELEPGRTRADFRIEDGSLSFPAVFREGFDVTSARGRIVVTGTAPALTVTLEEAGFENGDLQAHGRARLAFAGDGDPPHLEVEAALADVRLDASYPYLPVSVMSETLVAWLDRAVIAGRGTEGRFTYEGPASGAALREGRARLEAVVEASGVTLVFDDAWPHVEDAHASLTFTERGFEARVDRGTFAGAALGAGHVAIARYLAPELVVDARSTAPVERLMDAFRATPVGRAAWIADTQVSGPGALALRLAMPLGARGLALQGDLTLHGVDVAFGGFPHPLENARGSVRFTEDGVEAHAVSASMLGIELAARAETLRDGDGVARAVEIGFDGIAHDTQVAALIGRDGLPVSGATPLHARLFVPYGDEHVPFLEVESSLVGLEIALPAPLGKHADEVTPVSFHADLLPGLRRFRLDGGDSLQARGTLAAADGTWRLSRGHVHLGDAPLPEVPADAVSLTGRLASWTQGKVGVRDGLMGESPFTFIDVEVGELETFGRMLGATRVKGERAPGGWSWVLDGERIAGNLVVPDIPTPEAPIQALLDHVILAAPAPGDTTVAVDRTALDATGIPPVSFHATRLVVGPVDLGEVNGTLVPVENGTALEGFTAERRDLRIAGGATWHTVDGHHRTVVRATFDSNDVRRALAGLGYAASMDAAAGHLGFEVDWLGSPLDDPRPIANGVVRVRVERGTLYEVQPGAGRMFGLLSVNALPRRLALDFSDVYRRGLAFDSITGKFDLTEGDAHTDDLRLLGPAARVEIRGRTGLGTRDYDQEAVVVGSLASSLAIAGTLAGGPGVGAAMLIASEILKGPLEDMARIRYRVTGSWDQPVVERMAESSR